MALKLHDKFYFFNEREIWAEAGVLPKANFFKIWKPFWEKKEYTEEEKVDFERKSKKRKRGHGAVFLESATKVVKEAFSQWKTNFVKPIFVKTDNSIARDAASKVADFNFIEELSDLKNDNLVVKALEPDFVIELSPLTLFTNKTDENIVIYYKSHKFYVPKQCEFISGPVSALKHLYYANRTFDLIVIDPPWPNKSVKRFKTYKTFEVDDLHDLPIEGLINSKSLVAIWLTNNPTVHATIAEILETWGLIEITRWRWLKVTQMGDPVVSFDWGHKVPFEEIVFARPYDSIEILRFPKELTIISTPSSSHSRKPPLGLLIPKIINQTFSQKLEIYGRYFIPETITVGFEALKFQHIDTALDYDDINLFYPKLQSI